NSSASSWPTSPVRGASSVVSRAAHSFSEWPRCGSERPVPATGSNVIGNLLYRDAGPQNAQVPVFLQKIGAQDSGDCRNPCERATAPSEHGRPCRILAPGPVDTVGGVCQRMTHDPVDRAAVRIVEGEDAADAQQAVEIVEL